jgi:zinc transporter ZupT
VKPVAAWLRRNPLSRLLALACSWCVLTALPQALVAVPSYLFVEAFTALLPLAMGFAAGCMMWIVFAELLPDALEALPSEHVATTATASATW